jgi:TrmH family RNA methyltransferase
LITRNQVKRINRLKTRKRRDEGVFLVEGVRLVEELLDSELQVELAVVAPSLVRVERGAQLAKTIRDSGMQLAEVTDSELSELADTETPQGVLAIAREPSWELANLQPGDRTAMLVYDRLTDPGNLGTLMRTAHALGVDWCVALPGSVDPWSPKAVRASAGSVFHVPVSREPWPEVMNWLRERDFTIFCADPGGEPVTRGVVRGEGFALVLGNEPSGLSEEVRNACDARIGIHLSGKMDSLNVATAGALLLDRLIGDPDRS